MKYIVITVLLVIVAAGVTVFVYTHQRLQAMLNIHAGQEPKELPPGTQPETIFVVNADNQKIAYWYLPVKNAKAVVILVHGYRNPGGKSLMVDHIEYLRKAGYSTALVDLRAHGESEGNKIYLGTKEWQDIEAVYDDLRIKPENQNKKIGYLGISMGATSSLVAQGKTQKGDFVIASVPFKNLDSLFTHQISREQLPPSTFLPFLKASAILELGKDYNQNTPAAIIKDIHVPTLYMSADRDRDVNPNDAVELYTQANEPKQLLQVDSEHDIFYFYPEEFKTKVLDFLEQYVS